MAQLGPLLLGVRRLAAQLGPGLLIDQPIPLLPVRLTPDSAGGGVRLEVMVTIATVDLAARARALRDVTERGFLPSTDTGAVLTGSVCLADLEGLENAHDSVYIEAAARVLPELNASVPEAWNGLATWNGVVPTGAGVLVGVIDTGVDITHPSLRTQSGDTRVVRLWDHHSQQGVPAPTAYRYGSEWRESDINSYLSSGRTFPSADRDGHGTAVAGITASNGLAFPGTYVGVAESVNLIVVRLDARPSLFAVSNNVIDAVEYVFSVADELETRVVVNLSQGSQIGPHDPNGQFEQAITGILNADPKRILVTSTGNLGDDDMHARYQLSTGAAADILVAVPPNVGPFVVLDIWYDIQDQLSVELHSPATGASSGVVPGSGRLFGQLGPDLYAIAGLPNALGVGASQIHLQLSAPGGNVSAGTWRLRLIGTSMTSGNDIHAWLDAGTPFSPRFGSNVSHDCTATAPAAAREVLSVGSYRMSPNLGQLSASSGRGPDRSGNPLHLLAAPGTPITTCEANTASHTVVGGTSHAAAHVSGAIALMLGSDAGLTRKQAIDCLLKNTRAAGLGPATGWGAGKLDIHAALACAMANSESVREPSMSLDAVVTSTPGLFDLVEGLPDPDTRYDHAVQAYLATPGVAGTEAEAGLLEALEGVGGTSEGNEWIQKIGRFFKGESHNVVDTVDQPFLIAAYWLPLPQVSGASAELTVDCVRGKSTTMEIKILGIGGGAGKDIAIREGLTAEAKKHPQRIDVSMTARFAKIEVTKRGRTIATYPRLIDIDDRSLEWKFTDDDGAHQPRTNDVAWTAAFDRRDSGEKGTVSLEIKRGKSWDAQAGLEIPRLGLTATLKRQCVYQYDVAYKYVLPAGHRYRVTQYTDTPTYYWSLAD